MKITIVFTNGGAAIARFETDNYTYIHCYDNMIQLAKDFDNVVITDGADLSIWEGNEPEQWNDEFIGCLTWEVDTAKEKAYDAISELDADWGGNVAEFIINARFA